MCGVVNERVSACDVSDSTNVSSEWAMSMRQLREVAGLFDILLVSIHIERGVLFPHLAKRSAQR